MKLNTWLRTVMKERGILSNRELARRVNEYLLKVNSRHPGLGHSTINRIMAGEGYVSIQTIMALAAWADVNPSLLLDATGLYKKQESPLEKRLALFLETCPQLREVCEEMMSLIDQGRLSPTAVRNILLYGIQAELSRAAQISGEAEEGASAR